MKAQLADGANLYAVFMQYPLPSISIFYASMGQLSQAQAGWRLVAMVLMAMVMSRACTTAE